MNWISVKDRLPLSGAIVLGTSYTMELGKRDENFLLQNSRRKICRREERAQESKDK